MKFITFSYVKLCVQVVVLSDMPFHSISTAELSSLLFGKSKATKDDICNNDTFFNNIASVCNNSILKELDFAYCTDDRATTWSLKSPKVPFLNTWSLMSLNLKKWPLKSLFLFLLKRAERDS